MLRLIQLDLTRRRLRAAPAVTGIAVGVAAVVALLALGKGIERSAAPGSRSMLRGRKSRA